MSDAPTRVEDAVADCIAAILLNRPAKLETFNDALAHLSEDFHEVTRTFVEKRAPGPFKGC